MPEAPRKAALLLHGYGRSGLSMGLLAARLEAAGWATFAPSYGFHTALTTILARLAGPVAEFAARHDRLDIVTHSMGGLVARALLTAHRPPNLGRVVMCAPPNRGSELADLLVSLNLAHTILGPAHAHLVTRRTAEAEALLGPPNTGVDYELGIIAGNRSLTPVPARLLPSPHDGKVSVQATHLAGMADHIVVPVPHSLMTAHPASTSQALHFLSEGRFRH
jgi:pimeloyl-ACP methyl ester carboxylesterase